MYRNILLCYDGTAEGRRALRQGADVAMLLRRVRQRAGVPDLRTDAEKRIAAAAASAAVGRDVPLPLLLICE